MMDPLMAEYLQEAREHLANIEGELLAMEAEGDQLNEERVNGVFRAAHSIKGGAGFFSLDNIQKLAHRLESILDMIRTREMRCTPEVVNLLLLSFDCLRDMINSPEKSEEVDIETLITSLDQMTSAYLEEKAKEGLKKTATVNGASEKVHVSEFDLKQARKGGKHIYLLDLDLMVHVHGRSKTPWAVFKDLMDCGKILDCAWDWAVVGGLEDEPAHKLPFQVLYATVMDASTLAPVLGLDPQHISVVPVSVPVSVPVPTMAVQENHVVEPPPPTEPTRLPVPAVSNLNMGPKVGNGSKADVALPQPENPEVEKPKAKTPSKEDGTLRVNLALLEKLMDLAGEMVLARNQLVAAVTLEDMRSVQMGTQRINQVTSELQETIMLTRMQPIGKLLDKYPRVVRDLAKTLGKEIQLSLVGRDVEMDRSILEDLSDPLTHMVRNAVDHGVEVISERLSKGKPAAGTLDLRVYHEAGQVVVEIQDDGRGLDLVRIKEKALQKGLITPEHARQMTEKEQMALIFAPGLSTAQNVSNLSGRGVGMDVVKANLEKLGGSIDIESRLDQGTLFRIKLPLTLAIVPSLLVQVGGESFAIPEVNVLEMQSLSYDEWQERLNVMGGSEVLHLRGELIPLLRLGTALGVPCGAANKAVTGDLNVVIVNGDGFHYGLVVDELQDTIEIVVKPLGRHLKGLREYAGATILGDGGVALILDVSHLASFLQGDLAKEIAPRSVPREQSGEGSVRRSLLLFENVIGEHCAVFLDQVQRIMRVESDQIESLGGVRTMQHAGKHLKMIALSDFTSLASIEKAQDQVVMIFNLHGEEVGLLGMLPIDSVEFDGFVDAKTHRQKGILGSCIIGNQSTLLVDVYELLGMTAPIHAWDTTTQQDRVRILLVEDSDFFRGQMKQLFESADFEVLEAADGEMAWDLLKEQRVDLVVTDIEMPHLNGLELAERIRHTQHLAELPILAVSNLAGREDIEKAKTYGVTDYQIKLDPENLLLSVQRLLESKKEKA